jgi:hypothetical protein
VADRTTASEVEVVKSSAAAGSLFRFLAALKRAEWLRWSRPFIGCPFKLCGERRPPPALALAGQGSCGSL